MQKVSSPKIETYMSLIHVTKKKCKILGFLLYSVLCYRTGYYKV